jgi:hypothetical protein
VPKIRRRHLSAIASLSVAAALAGLPVSAGAGSPLQLTSGQLDLVTAGSSSLSVNALALADATGANATTSTSTTTALGAEKGIQPGFGAQAGVASGVAAAFGLPSASGSLPASHSTQVVTQGTVAGNYVQAMTINVSSYAAGLLLQGGWTYVYGANIPGY